jgi:3-dehydroquinate dehydratase-2
VRAIRTECKKRGIRVSVVQTNDEGKLVTEIQKCYGKVDGIVINPAAYTHTSVAILDAVKAVGIPTVEVHLSDLSKREAFRQVSYIRQAVDLTVTGKGIDGYLEAIAYLDETYGKGKIR